MRYGIFSDIHANLEALNCVLDAYRSENIDKFLCVGDIVGYGANPKECIQIIRDRKIITVAGNHDWAVTKQFDIEFFNPYAKAAVLWTRKIIDDGDVDYLKNLSLEYRENNFYLVHGTPIRPQDFHYMFSMEEAYASFQYLKVPICFVGHTHAPVVFIKTEDKITFSQSSEIFIEQNKSYIFNVGSVGQPRDGDARACFCIYDTEKRTVTIKRIPYEVLSAQQKILRAGLPKFLALRLESGQ